jgi:hypothetical protein
MVTEIARVLALAGTFVGLDLGGEEELGDVTFLARSS